MSDNQAKTKVDSQKKSVFAALLGPNDISNLAIMQPKIKEEAKKNVKID